MTDKEHAKKYAEESISLAISMSNPKAVDIAFYACLYGLTYKNDKIKELEQKLEQTEKDLADYQFNYPTIKELEKENKTLEGCLLAEQELTQTLEKEKCELLGIIQEKDKVIEKMRCCANCSKWLDCKSEIPTEVCKDWKKEEEE